MRKAHELNGADCVDSDNLSNASEQLLFAAQQLIELQNPLIDTSVTLTVEQEIKAQLETLQKHPLLVTGIAVVETLGRFRVDYAYQQNHTQLLLQELVESIDCAAANPVEHWMQSDIAAIDKANELGISILPEYSMADLRYKIQCAINEVL